MDIGSCMFPAGFPGDHAIRAVFLMIGGRPMIFDIMVDMDQKVCVLRSSFAFQRNAWFASGYNLRSSTDFSYSSAMLGLTVDTYVALVVVLAVAWFLPVCWLR